VNTDGEWRTTEQVAELRSVAEILLDAPCWKAGFSYGDELYLDFGRQRVYGPGPLRGQLYGEWELYTRASPWGLRDSEGRPLIAAADDRERSEPRLAGLMNSRVSGVAISESDLSVALEFTNGLRFELSCEQEDDDEDELSCWELVGDTWCVEVWPGGRWRIVPYDHSWV
jgi:hypothetical protein